MHLTRILVVLAFLSLPLAGCLEQEGGSGSDADDAPAPSTTVGSGGSQPPATTPAATTPAASTPAPTGGGNASSGEGPLARRTLAAGQGSGHEEAARLVIEDEAAWARFWETHGSTSIPAPERPEVDFSREVVVAPMLGTKSNTCWAVRVTGATAEASRVVVEVTTYEPPRGAFCGMAMTQPHHVVALPRTGKPVTFDEKTTQGPPQA